MVKNHLKTLASSKALPVARKSKVYILRPNAGPHSLQESMSLNFVLIDLLNLVKTKKECQYILHNKEVLVDGKRRKDIAYPVGLFDVMTLKDIKKSYRILLNPKGKYYALEISSKENQFKPIKVMGKKLWKKKIQLNFSDGRNLSMDKTDISTGDTVVLNFIDNSIKEHVKLERGTLMLLTGGKNRGSTGKVEDIINRKVIYKLSSGEVIETLKKYAFALGKTEPVVKVK